MPLFKYYLKRQTTAVDIAIYPAAVSAVLMTEIPTASIEFSAISAAVSVEAKAEVSIGIKNVNVFADTYHYASCHIEVSPAEIYAELFQENKINVNVNICPASIDVNQGSFAVINIYPAFIKCNFENNETFDISIEAINATISAYAVTSNSLSVNIKAINCNIQSYFGKPINSIEVNIPTINAKVDARLSQIIEKTFTSNSDVLIFFEEAEEVI